MSSKDQDLQEDCMQLHLTGKKHLHNLRQFEAVKRSIVVTSSPGGTSEEQLINFFQKYGRIEWYKFGANDVIIQFDNSNTVKRLLRRPILLNNVKLNIKKRMLYQETSEWKESNNKDVGDTSPVSYGNIKGAIKKVSKFEDQLKVFLNKVQLSDTEIKTKYEIVVKQLNKIFKEKFPKCVAHRFGSTLTGICFIACDLDIYIDIGVPVCETENALPGSWTMQAIFKEARRIMYKMKSVFSNVIWIPKAKIPIIKFCHVPTGISCDVSFKNGIAIDKSRLVKYCISLDERVKPLMMIIKYWVMHLCTSRSRVSSYGFIMLIIFYLQQPSVKIIPPLSELQDKNQVKTKNGWTVSFDEYSTLPPSTNKSSIPELLHGFFQFYATFEFESYVICPLDGIAHPNFEFENLEGLPQCMSKYVDFVKTERCSKLLITHSICIQDPVELNTNITKSIHLETLKTFVTYCAISADICAATSKNNYQNLITALLSQPKIRAKNKKLKINISPNYLILHNLAKRYHPLVNSTQDAMTVAENTWYFVVLDIIKDIFERVFKMSVEIKSTDREAKQQKIEVLTDVHTKEHQNIVMHCMGSYMVWENRKLDLSIVLDCSLSSLEKEARMSELAIQNSKGKYNHKKCNLRFKCTCKRKKKRLQVLLTICNENSVAKTFLEFSKFATKKLPEIVEQTITHMQNFNELPIDLYGLKKS